MRINAVYFINVIDAHLAKVAGIDFSFKDASLAKIVAKISENPNANKPRTCGMDRSRLLSIAIQKGDSFAKTFLHGENWKKDYMMFGALESFRNTLAHGGTLSQESVDSWNAHIEGFNLDADGYFDLTADMETAFAMIKTKVADSVEYLASFRRIELAFGELVRSNGEVFRGSAEHVISRALEGRVGRSLRSLWKVNNIRNRYVHTGRITAKELDYCRRFAASLNTTF